MNLTDKEFHQILSRSLVSHMPELQSIEEPREDVPHVEKEKPSILDEEVPEKLEDIEGDAKHKDVPITEPIKTPLDNIGDGRNNRMAGGALVQSTGNDTKVEGSLPRMVGTPNHPTAAIAGIAGAQGRSGDNDGNGKEMVETLMSNQGGGEAGVQTSSLGVERSIDTLSGYENDNRNPGEVMVAATSQNERVAASTQMIPEKVS